MAQYKVLQDIEAEDKLVGPLTLRQFIYAGITAVCLYVCFIAITKHVYFLLPIFLLPGALTGFFAFPFARDQPTEVWALAKIRFLFKPRRRVWNQSGVKQLVTVTAPKKIETNYTDNLSQSEVKSRLRALADTIDTRGWAIKNVTQGIYQPALPGSRQADRLIDISNLPPELPTVADQTTDMMDDHTSPMAQNFDNMIRESDQNHKQQVVNSINHFSQPDGRAIAPPTGAGQLPPNSPPAQQPNDYWFMSQPPAMPSPTNVVAPASTPVDDTAATTDDEKELSSKLHSRHDDTQISHSHLHTILPLSEQKALAEKTAKEAEEARAKAAQAPVTQPPDPAIIALAGNNDLNVDTIARQAKRQSGDSPDEVVISLH